MFVDVCVGGCGCGSVCVIYTYVSIYKQTNTYRFEFIGESSSRDVQTYVHTHINIHTYVPTYIHTYTYRLEVVG